MVHIAPLLYAIPVLSHFNPTSKGLVARQSIDPSSLPSACQSPCQVITTMSDCNGSLDCVCATSIGSQLEQCMGCLVNAEPAAESEAQSALSSWNQACNGSLSLSGGSSSDGATSTSSATSPSETGASSSSDGATSTTSATSPSETGASSNGDSGSKGNGAIGLGAGGMVACIVATFAGAFMSL